MAFAGSNLRGKFPDGKPMVGLINTKKLNKIVNIFGEIFDFTLEIDADIVGEEYHKMKMKTPLIKSSSEEVKKWKEKKNSGHVDLNKYFEEENYVFTEQAPETYLTVSDFIRLYLGWLSEDEIFIKEITVEEINKIKEGLIKLFRFIFDTKPLKNVSKVNNELKKLDGYITPLLPEEKFPCKGSFLWYPLKISLEHRKELAFRELVGKQLTLTEDNLEVEKTKELLMGLENLIASIESGEDCMRYGTSVLADDDFEKVISEKTFKRLLMVFERFIKSRKGLTPQVQYSENESLQLRKELSENIKSNSSDTSDEIYTRIIKLLKWFDKDENTNTNLVGNSTGAGSADEEATKEEIENLNKLVDSLAAYIIYTESIHKLDLSVQELKSHYEKLTAIEEAIDKVEKKLSLKKKSIFKQVGGSRAATKSPLGGLYPNAPLDVPGFKSYTRGDNGGAAARAEAERLRLQAEAERIRREEEEAERRRQEAAAAAIAGAEAEAAAAEAAAAADIQAQREAYIQEQIQAEREEKIRLINYIDRIRDSIEIILDTLRRCQKTEGDADSLETETQLIDQEKERLDAENVDESTILQLTNLITEYYQLYTRSQELKEHFCLPEVFNHVVQDLVLERERIRELFQAAQRKEEETRQLIREKEAREDARAAAAAAAAATTQERFFDLLRAEQEKQTAAGLQETERSRIAAAAAAKASDDSIRAQEATVRATAEATRAANEAAAAAAQLEAARVEAAAAATAAAAAGAAAAAAEATRFAAEAAVRRDKENEELIRALREAANREQTAREAAAAREASLHDSERTREFLLTQSQRAAETAAAAAAASEAARAREAATAAAAAAAERREINERERERDASMLAILSSMAGKSCNQTVTQTCGSPCGEQAQRGGAAVAPVPMRRIYYCDRTSGGAPTVNYRDIGEHEPLPENHYERLDDCEIACAPPPPPPEKITVWYCNTSTGVPTPEEKKIFPGERTPQDYDSKEECIAKGCKAAAAPLPPPEKITVWFCNTSTGVPTPEEKKIFPGERTPQDYDSEKECIAKGCKAAYPPSPLPAPLPLGGGGGGGARSPSPKRKPPPKDDTLARLVKERNLYKLIIESFYRANRMYAVTGRDKVPTIGRTGGTLEEDYDFPISINPDTTKSYLCESYRALFEAFKLLSDTECVERAKGAGYLDIGRGRGGIPLSMVSASGRIEHPDPIKREQKKPYPVEGEVSLEECYEFGREILIVCIRRVRRIIGTGKIIENICKFCGTLLNSVRLLRVSKGFKNVPFDAEKARFYEEFTAKECKRTFDAWQTVWTSKDNHTVNTEKRNAFNLGYTSEVTLDPCNWNLDIPGFDMTLSPCGAGPSSSASAAAAGGAAAAAAAGEGGGPFDLVILQTNGNAEEELQKQIDMIELEERTHALLGGASSASPPSASSELLASHSPPTPAQQKIQNFVKGIEEAELADFLLKFVHVKDIKSLDISERPAKKAELQQKLKDILVSLKPGINPDSVLSNARDALLPSNPGNITQENGNKYLKEYLNKVFKQEEKGINRGLTLFFIYIADKLQAVVPDYKAKMLLWKDEASIKSSIDEDVRKLARMIDGFDNRPPSGGEKGYLGTIDLMKGSYSSDIGKVKNIYMAYIAYLDYLDKTAVPLLGGGGGRPRKQVGGSREPKDKTFCDSILSMLLVSAAESPEFNARDVLERSQKSLDIARCPLVLSVLERMIDNTLEVNDSEEFKYTPLTQDEEAGGIIDSFHENFEPKHMDMFNKVSSNMIYYGKPPEEYEGAMGKNSYILSGIPNHTISGLDEEPVELTDDELINISIKQKGIPLGALLLLHALSVRQKKYGLKAPEFIDGRQTT